MYPGLGVLAAQDALNSLKMAARSAPAIMVGVTIATTALANVPGMGQAKSNWGALAKALEVEYPGMVGNAVFMSRAGWIADDREAFLHAASVFGGDLQKLSGLCYAMEGQVDQVRDAYYVYWVQIGVLAGSVITYILACQAMKLTPHLRAMGEVLLQRLSQLTVGMIAHHTKVLYGFLGVAAGVLGTSVQSLGQLFTLQPSGATAIDFQRAVIKTDPPREWIAPKKDAPAPAETEEEEEEKKKEGE